MEMSIDARLLNFTESSLCELVSLQATLTDKASCPLYK